MDGVNIEDMDLETKHLWAKKVKDAERSSSLTRSKILLDLV